MSKCYDQWLMLQGKVDSYYHDKPQERIPLSQQKEFRQIKNAIIQEAKRLHLGEITFEEKGLNQQDEPEEFQNASYDYWTLRDIIRDESLTMEERSDAVSEMDKLAENGDMYAQYLMGKLWRDGPLLIPNSQKAKDWFTQAAEHGLPEQDVRGFLEYQILTDFVLTNTDRHLNNFGVLRDSRTLRFVQMAPIFDSGNSMFWDAPRLPERSECTEITVNSFRKTETELLKLVTDRSRVRMELLPSREEIAELYAKDDSIAFVDSILTGYEKKKALLEHFMEKGIPAQIHRKRNTEPER